MRIVPAARWLSRHERLLIAAALVLIVIASWAYLIHLAVAMNAHANIQVMSPSLSDWTLPDAALMFIMWAVMMVAMMLPSAAPMILLYAAIKSRSQRASAHCGAFAAGYVVIWLGFSVAATWLQWHLEKAASIMTTVGSVLGATILLVAGLYQLTPLKNRCLSRCRAPAQFISAHWRHGVSGAFRMGLTHGAYCLGCCWALMLLLFVFGVMNLLWIAGLSVYVLMEKLVPHGDYFSRITGGVLVLAGLSMLV